MDTARKNYSRIASFSSGDKINLLNKIKEERILWDITHKRHFDVGFTKTAWKRVAEVVDKDENSCKSAWKSLRDSYRYHCKSAKFKNRGNPDENPGILEEVDWKYAPYMAFLPEFSTKKNTFTSNFTEETEADEYLLEDSMGTEFLETDTSSLVENELQLEKELSEVNESLFSYEKRQKVEEPAETPAKRMVEMLASYLKANPAPPAPAQPRPVFGYWDSLLNQLPPRDALAAEREITELLWKKIAKTQN